MCYGTAVESITLAVNTERDLSDQDIAQSTPDPFDILQKILASDEIDRDAFRLSLWVGFYTGGLFTELQSRFGLHRDESNVLFSLAQYGQLTAKSICEALGRPRNSISRAVERLMRKALILAETDPTDRRQVLLTATSEGEQMCRRILQVSRARESVMLSCLSPAERLALDSVLTKLVDHAPDWMSAAQKPTMSRLDSTADLERVRFNPVHIQRL